MYGYNEFETKENKIWTKDKIEPQHIHLVVSFLTNNIHGKITQFWLVKINAVFRWFSVKESWFSEEEGSLSAKKVTNQTFWLVNNQEIHR